MTFDEILALPPYGLGQAEKEQLLTAELNALTAHHIANCDPYARLVRGLNRSPKATRLEDVPFLPVGLFKTHRLASIPAEQQFKTLTSSGTTGQQVSQIVLDAETARRQTVALSRIMTYLLGPQRLPMILVDSTALLRDRQRLGARAAGVVGMMNFGRAHFYALDENMKLNEDGLREFLEKHKGSPVLLFGFTFMVWQYLLEQVRGKGIDLSNGTLIHSGGWKKLQELAVTNAELKRQFREETGLSRIFNFYGMVEQVGSVFLEGDQTPGTSTEHSANGWLYPPAFADVIIRDPITFEPLPPGQPGLIQVLSVVPLSYPGHSILTEDLGVIHAIDPAGTDRKGKAFSVLGRLPKSELRGCSDTHAAQRALSA
jgi:acyl-CoA synthetase (AMP-forming)/AMP-acid ligase II